MWSWTTQSRTDLYTDFFICVYFPVYNSIHHAIVTLSRLFQEFYGIKATGKLNKKTVKIMKEPRCGIPDIRVDDPYSPIRQFHFYKYCEYIFVSIIRFFKYFFTWTSPMNF